MNARAEAPECRNTVLLRKWRTRGGSGSAIIQHFAAKSSIFMLLGACRLKIRFLVLIAGLCAVASLISCGGGSKRPKIPPSGLHNRVLAAQSVTSTHTFGGLVLIDGRYDIIPRVAPLPAGGSPGLMAISPTRNILVALDTSTPATPTVYAIDTVNESSLGHIQLPGPSSSITVPTASPIGYAAVATAWVNGYSFVGGVEVMNLTAGSIVTTIAVTNAQTVVSNSTDSELLVFSNDSDSMTLLAPGAASPPVDTSCFTSPPNAVCTIMSGFSRPVYAVINGSTAYILNCGFQCGGSQPASVAIFDLYSNTITNTIPVDAATMAFLHGTTLYVAGTSPTNHACTGQTTASTSCGRLNIIDLSLASPKVIATAVITDGYHDRMDMSINGQLFIGSHDCTNIGNANNPSGEVRGCLTILDTTNGAIVVPPDNGDVNGLQSFSTRFVEYVAEGGNLRVYDTTKDVLLENDYIPQGTIDVVGYVGDVKAIDFF